MNLNFNNIAAFAVLGSIVACWNQFKVFFGKIFSIFIRTDTLRTWDINQYVLDDILKQSKIIRWGNNTWGSETSCFVNKFNAWTPIIIKLECSLFCLYKNKIPLFIKNLDQSSGVKITYFYKTFDLPVIMEESFGFLIECQKRSMQRIKNFHYSEDSGRDSLKSDDNDLGAFANPSPPSQPDGSIAGETKRSSPFNHFTLKNHSNIIGFKYSDIGTGVDEKETSYFWSKESLLLKDEVEFWADNVSWFKQRNISHRRSVLLYGVPGCGKSKMVLKCAQEVGVPVTKLNISNMSDTEFKYYYNSGGDIQIVLVEDIDAVFNMRKNILSENSHQKNLLSFDTLINTIAGVKENDGIFLVITTNHKELLDEALLRPGRLDVHIEVQKLCIEGRRVIAQNILRDWPILVEQAVIECDGMTAAETENYCVEKALKKFYENRDKTLAVAT